jgi:hypothetical protein
VFHFHDSGTPSFLLRPSDADQILAGVSAGPVFEAAMLILSEAKLTATPPPRTPATSRSFKRSSATGGKGPVICRCRERFPLTRKVDAGPFGSFWRAASP